MVFDIGTLDALAADIGAPVPNGDPSAIFAFADQLEASARTWDDNADALARLRSRLRSVLVGETGDASDKNLAGLLNGRDSLQNDSEALRAGVKALRNYAADLQDNQWTSRMLAAWLLATMIRGAASVIATGGESLFQVALAWVQTAAAITALKEMLWERIAGILMELMINAGRGVLLGGAQQLVMQGIEVAMGNRHGINTELVAGTGLSFAEFGVGAEAVEHGLYGLVSDAVKDSRTGSLAAWAASKVLSGMGGNTVATLAGGGSITPETLWTGAAMGAAGALGDARGKGASVPQYEPTATAVPANAVGTHPTVSFEKGADGVFHWPGETANGTEPQAHTFSSTATTEPPVAAGEPGTASHALPGAADPGGRSVEGTTTTPPARADAVHLSAAGLSARVDPPPAAHASVGSNLPEGALDSSISSPAAAPAPSAVAAGSAVSPSLLDSNVVSVAAPTVPTAAAPPSSAPTVPSAAGPPFPAPTSKLASPGPNAGLSSPTLDPPARPADTSHAGKPIWRPAVAPAAGGVDTTAIYIEPGIHNTPAEHAASAQAVGVDSPAQAARPEPGSHATGRQDSPDRQRPAEPVTKRQDPSTRPDVNRRDLSTGPRDQPGKLNRGRNARDVPEDLQSVAATGTPDPLAADGEIGVISARHNSGRGPGQPESQQGHGNRIDGHNTPEPGTAGGGACDGSGRGGAGGAGASRAGGEAGDEGHDGDNGGGRRDDGTNEGRHDPEDEDFLRQQEDVSSGSVAEENPAVDPAGIDVDRVDTTPTVYPANRVGLGRWLRAMRRAAGLTQEQFGLAVASGRSAVSQANISSIENGNRGVSEDLAHDLCIAARGSDALWRQARAHFFPPADTTLASYPADAVGFGRLLAALRDNAGMSQEQLASAADLSRVHVNRIENGRWFPPRATARSLCRGVGAGAHWPQVRARFFPPVDTTPANHTLGSWLKAHLENADLTQTQLAATAHVSRWVFECTRDASRPSLRTFRLLCDALDIHGPPRIEAIRRFYSNRYRIEADPEDERDLWLLVDTAPDSPQERKLRNQIYERHEGIAKNMARRGVRILANHYGLRVDYQDLYQDARAATLIAIVNHVPTSPLIVHVFANCRGAIVKVADALLQERQHEASPVTGRSGDETHPEVADQTATAAFADSDFVATVRAALADLPDPDTATRLVILHVVDGTPLDQAAQLVGLSPQTAAAIISTAIPLLRTAFHPLPG
jgi:transcriptional regulator with XRE-family HTH domain/DNA-directed RNA polymerase specialized sigma24 family protein